MNENVHVKKYIRWELVRRKPRDSDIDIREKFKEGKVKIETRLGLE